MIPTPRFAILSPHALVAIGLKSLLERIAPGVEVTLFGSLEELQAEERHEHFFHYFVEASWAWKEDSFFREKLHRTILLVEGDPQPECAGCHCLNICQSEAALVSDLLRIYHRGHSARGASMRHTRPERQLTAREADVLRLLARGLINKQIADRLGVRLTTVISHRRNLSRKLGIRSASALAIYAVMNGYADPVTDSGE